MYTSLYEIQTEAGVTVPALRVDLDADSGPAARHLCEVQIALLEPAATEAEKEDVAMGVYRRGKVYWIDYYNSEGKRHREPVGPGKEGREAAHKRLSSRVDDVKMGRLPEVLNIEPVTFREHAQKCLAEHYSKKRGYEWAKIEVDVHLIPYFGDKLLTQITAQDVSEYMTRRKEAGAANATVNNERAVLSKIMTLAIKWGRILKGSNPVAEVDKLEVTNGRLRFLTHGEADKLIQHAPRHLKPLIVTALETGGRLAELLSLEWSAIDLERGFLYFDQLNTKSGKQREVPLTPLLAETLRELSKVRSLRNEARDRVFTYHGKPIRDVRTGFSNARQNAGLGPDVTMHTLRHTFASWYMMNGGDLYLLRDLLGHQDVKMTMRYAHLSPTYRKSAVPRLGRHGHTLVTVSGSSEDDAAASA